MLDSFRDPSDDAFFKEEEPAQEIPEPKTGKSFRHRTFDQITGTTAFQRFTLSLMLLITICLLGFMLLVFTGKIIPSFLY
jgi:hypothetical protein